MRGFYVIIISLFILVLAACGTASQGQGGASANGSATNQGAPTAKSTASKEDKNIKLIVTSSNFHDELLPVLKAEVEKSGFQLEAKAIEDGIIANKEVLEKNYDFVINMHEIALKEYNKENKTDLREAFTTIFAPIGVYSHKYKSLADLPNGATISIPDDDRNGGRALFILQDAGLLKFKEGLSVNGAKPKDIIENPKNFKFKEVNYKLLLRALDDVDAGLLYSSQRDAAKFTLKDALAVESPKTKGFWIVAAARPELLNTSKAEALKKAYYSQTVKDFFIKKFGKDDVSFAW
ncbi:MetQ/NlpA family ABC transporter substrate-binding protein [Paenibacillus periandrae]|uniref:MetQ/NlpA family ABC transporter substrate-binding protein n=1 Tax=Paenibacillus periandrae TaxID=1761741 RepID=UPI001F096409|nr:MetQ/NlpA family ABC transporter substrate-binding protein [Paenibacillus periandrae]